MKNKSTILEMDLSDEAELFRMTSAYYKKNGLDMTVKVLEKIMSTLSKREQPHRAKPDIRERIIKITEANLEQIVRKVIQEQSTEFDKVGVDEWINQNDVEFRTFVAPNPYSEGDLNIGIMAVSNGQPIGFPPTDKPGDSRDGYPHYRNEMAGKLTNLIITDSSGKQIYNGKVDFLGEMKKNNWLMNESDPKGDSDRFYITLTMNDNIISAIKNSGQDLLMLNFFDSGSEVYNAAMKKYKVKGAKLSVK
jgi:hypothetical protein